MRTAFVYVPNGVIQPDWWPDGAGKDFTFNRTLKPLEPYKQRLQVIGGLDHVNATAGPDGPGDHARASGTFLTGVRVRKTAGSDIHAGVSIDQVLAQSGRPLDAVSVVGAELRLRPPLGQLRLGLFLRLSIQPRVEFADHSPAP